MKTIKASVKSNGMTSDDDSLIIRRRRAFYRAFYRGTKEMDWMLGRFAEAELQSMGVDDLGSFEKLLALPDPDVEKWLINDQKGGDQDLQAIVKRVRRFHGLET